MKYIIVSERVGTPGDVYEPQEGINVDALVEFGFLKLADKKTAKITKNTEQE